jgi:hypothetical protein
MIHGAPDSRVRDSPRSLSLTRLRRSLTARRSPFRIKTTSREVPPPAEPPRTATAVVDPSVRRRLVPRPESAMSYTHTHVRHEADHSPATTLRLEPLPGDLLNERHSDAASACTSPGAQARQASPPAPGDHADVPHAMSCAPSRLPRFSPHRGRAPAGHVTQADRPRKTYATSSRQLRAFSLDPRRRRSTEAAVPTPLRTSTYFPWDLTIRVPTCSEPTDKRSDDADVPTFP